jgi:hypothetical protein
VTTLLTKIPALVQKYLQRYADGSAGYAACLQGSWSHILVVPVFAEDFNAVLAVAEQIAAPAALLEIWVLNAPESATHDQLALHRMLLDDLERLADECLVLVPGMRLVRIGGRHIVVLEYWEEGQRLAVREGVGLARKKGADLALALWASGRVQHRWLWMTDADARLPPDYFERLVNKFANSASYRHAQRLPVACVYPFSHLLEGSPAQQAALQQYEAKIRHYRAGLLSAGSPYAFTALGSLIACDMQAYAMVRGIPRRAAAEDFYLLNKLAKTGRIEHLDGAPVILSGRISLRVPFGTGRALAEALQNDGTTARLDLYPPHCFTSLGVFLHAAGTACQAPGWTAEQRLAYCAEQLTLHHFAPRKVMTCFDALQIGRGLRSLQAGHGPVQVQQQFHEWFDALKTLQWIHWWRDHA